MARSWPGAKTGDGRRLILLHGSTATGLKWLGPGPAAAIAEQRRIVLRVLTRGTLPRFRGHRDRGADKARPGRCRGRALDRSPRR
jgi:hypothetical protein